MGKAIIRVLASGSDAKLVGAVEKDGHPDLGKDAGLVAGVEETGVRIGVSVEDGADVVIVFSSPEGSAAILDDCERTGAAVVVGTTGLGEEFTKRVGRAARKIACVVSPSMSVGMNMLFGVVGKVARTLGPEYDIEIVEAHHRMKKDAPSGSAAKLAECIQKEIGSMDVVYGRQGMTGERKPRELGIHAVRAGEIAGIHTIMYSGPGETIEITHRAQGRDAYAAGAVKAAVFAAKAAPGIYSMADVLGTSTKMGTERR
jgi:4-hydroxy-tetrahydrodipicolinate reductase